MSTARDALLARNKRRYKDSTVDLDGQRIRWQSLSELEKSNFEAAAQHTDKARARSARVNLRLRVIVACAVDAAGQRLFCDADLPAMQQLDGDIVQALADEAMAHVGWTEADAEQMEDVIKNSTATPAAASPTS